MNTLLQTYRIPLLMVLASLVFYWSFAYQLERSDFIKLLSLYAALFFLFYKLIQTNAGNYKFLFWTGIAFRAAFLLAIPNLSQDFYRFLWDGRLLIEGINPYLSTPNSFALTEMKGIYQAQQLINGMGALNASHYSNYPPVSQFVYAIAALFAGSSILGSVIVLRLVLIAADIGILLFGKKLLEKLNLPKHYIFWFFLNPFIIIELTGNLHFEGVMVFFLVAALYFMVVKKWLWSALFLGLSVSTKLIPLLFLPLLLPYFLSRFPDKITAFKKLSLYYLTVFGTVLLLFLPFLSEAFIQNFSKTISLWFVNFEFNASVYYLIRWIGFETVGWNIIGTVGKILPVVVVLFVMYLSFFRKTKNGSQLLILMLFGICFYHQIF
ncbi:glycosyltransferase 87 family protein [uncultured Planktosalinus sp.]|uniref:glycosyltransferase 87 family protein n=1 Tax=uncultured Planktosalinus sp. TaxID=1810935 RepID=UPI0030DD6A17